MESLAKAYRRARSPAPEPVLKFAVQIRAHQVTDKLLDLIDQLRGSDRFDLFLSYDVKDGPVDLPGATTLPYTLQTFHDLGLPVEPGEPERKPSPFERLSGLKDQLKKDN